MGGIGKTSLAVQWSQHNQASFPDGQLYVDLRGVGPATPLSSAAAVRRMLGFLGVANAAVPVDLDAGPLCAS